MGNITPEIFDNIKNYSKIYYYTGGSYSGPSEFYSGFNNRKLDYTRIKLNPPSKYLTEDLWMENKTPAKILLPRMIVNNYDILELILLLAFSAVTSVIAGVAVSPLFRNKWGVLKLALFGFANLFTVFIYAVVLFSAGSTSLETPEDRKFIREIRKDPVVKRWNAHFRDVYLMLIISVVLIFALNLIRNDIFYIVGSITLSALVFLSIYCVFSKNQLFYREKKKS